MSLVDQLKNFILFSKWMTWHDTSPDKRKKNYWINSQNMVSSSHWACRGYNCDIRPSTNFLQNLGKGFKQHQPVQCLRAQAMDPDRADMNFLPLVCYSCGPGHIITFLWHYEWRCGLKEIKNIKVCSTMSAKKAYSTSGYCLYSISDNMSLEGS